MILLYSAREHFVVPQDFSFKMDIAGHISEINVSHTQIYFQPAVCYSFKDTFLLKILNVILHMFQI